MTRRTPNLTLAPWEHLDLNPDDAARLAVTDSDRVRVTSRRGSLTAPVRVTDQVAPGELFLAFHFPEVAANLLASAQTDAVTSCPEYKIVAVRLSKT